MRKVIQIALFLTTVLVSAQNLSFKDAVLKLESGNKKLKGTIKKQESKVYAEKSMSGLRFPELKLSGSSVYMSDHIYADLNEHKPKVQGLMKKYAPLVKSFQPLLMKHAKLPQVRQLMGAMKEAKASMHELMKKDWKYKFQDKQFSKVTLELKYPIFTGGKINAGIKVKQLESEISEVETAKIKGKLIAKLAERYFQVKLVEEVIKVREQNLNSVKKHLYNAERMEKNGMLAPIQTLLAKSAVADAERAVLGSKKDAELARTALIGLLGGSYNYTKLTTNLFKLSKLKGIEHYKNLAQKNYPDIVKAEIQKSLAEQNIKFQKSGHLPNVAIIGKKNLYTKNLSMIEPQDWFVGLGFEMNLFHGLKHKFKIKEAKTLKEGVDLLIEQAKIDIQTLIEKHYTEILKQQEQLVSLEKSVSFSEELVRVREKSFKEGFATSTEVADSNLYMEAIKIKRLKAMFEIDKNLAKLLEICGQGNTFTQYQ